MKRAMIFISDLITGRVPAASQEAIREAELRRMEKHPPKTQAEKAFQKFLRDWHEQNRRCAHQQGNRSL